MPLKRAKTSITVGTLAVAAAACGSSGSDPADSERANVFDDAYRVCQALEATGLTTQCFVRRFGRTVDVTIDTSGSEARQICAGTVELIATRTRNFNGEWKLQVFSPYSGDRPIAACTLL